MNEALHILKYLEPNRNIKLEKLDISKAVKIKDMQTIIKDTKEYLVKIREEFKRCQAQNPK